MPGHLAVLAQAFIFFVTRDLSPFLLTILFALKMYMINMLGRFSY